MRLWALVASLLFLAAPVRAQVPDCMTEGYIGSFEGTGVEELTCAEVFRFTIPTH